MNISVEDNDIKAGITVRPVTVLSLSAAGYETFAAAYHSSTASFPLFVSEVDRTGQ